MELRHTSVAEHDIGDALTADDDAISQVSPIARAPEHSRPPGARAARMTNSDITLWTGTEAKARFPLWSTEMGTRINPDGTVAFVTIDPGIAGLDSVNQ